MHWGAALIGGVSGTCLHMMSNAVSKVPLSRRPYNHVICFFVGCWVGNEYVKLEHRLVAEINEMRADKGMPPMVGTHSYIKYKPADKI
mmetsp:Transcript_11275/g.16483  ORF Transcript_11275/g.16483 Transcript_11275/m.16483 type:complete len:88 (-) Transcript_11275:202-465(-)|eukprot:CAMPEP_0194039580 /NCGR_PEP_ID=MMETSP0009_2-20130614/11699_1 /TAXON_ID=210454 /ORGANISM="Grammatophora oceanica, Strain CCMP 410" /LENGTH=87 /DNA_ID=CAMNT_0038682471 /DNA_START=115 /DNA_END=378 /DNA_ORIENTATION=+